MNGKKSAPGRAKKTAPERGAGPSAGRKAKASQERRTPAKSATGPADSAGGRPKGQRSGAQQASATSGRPARGAGRGTSTRARRPVDAAPSLDAPPAETLFRDRDGQTHSFPESSLRRVAARLLSERRTLWRYRPFSFPLFTQTGREQSFTPDFVVYDHQEAVLRVLVVAPRETAEIWDRLGRMKRQYPSYPYELWTPEKLAQLTRPRARLGF